MIENKSIDNKTDIATPLITSGNNLFAKTSGCPFINGEDCFEDLQNCKNNYEKCSIYNTKNKMEGVLN